MLLDQDPDSECVSGSRRAILIQIRNVAHYINNLLPDKQSHVPVPLTSSPPPLSLIQLLTRRLFPVLVARKRVPVSHLNPGFQSKVLEDSGQVAVAPCLERGSGKQDRLLGNQNGATAVW